MPLTSFCSGLVWQVGSGQDFRLGMDLWPGCGQRHLLSNDLIEFLHHIGCRFLSDVRDEAGSSIHGQGWMSGT